MKGAPVITTMCFTFTDIESHEFDFQAPFEIPAHLHSDTSDSVRTGQDTCSHELQFKQKSWRVCKVSLCCFVSAQTAPTLLTYGWLISGACLCSIDVLEAVWRFLIHFRTMQDLTKILRLRRIWLLFVWLSSLMWSKTRGAILKWILTYVKYVFRWSLGKGWVITTIIGAMTVFNVSLWQY